MSQKRLYIVIKLYAEAFIFFFPHPGMFNRLAHALWPARCDRPNTTPNLRLFQMSTLYLVENCQWSTRRGPAVPMMPGEMWGQWQEGRHAVGNRRQGDGATFRGGGSGTLLPGTSTYLRNFAGRFNNNFPSSLLSFLSSFIKLCLFTIQPTRLLHLVLP